MVYDRKRSEIVTVLPPLDDGTYEDRVDERYTASELKDIYDEDVSANALRKSVREADDVQASTSIGVQPNLTPNRVAMEILRKIGRYLKVRRPDPEYICMATELRKSLSRLTTGKLSVEDVARVTSALGWRTEPSTEGDYLVWNARAKKQIDWAITKYKGDATDT